VTSSTDRAHRSDAGTASSRARISGPATFVLSVPLSSGALSIFRLTVF
jgi:hypothetical protein